MIGKQLIFYVVAGKGRERGEIRPSQAMNPPFPGILIDLLDLRALVGGLLGRSTSHAATHAAHVGHTCGEKTESSNRSQR